ncbi:Zinc finger CCHC domain-containing protein 8 [Bienertia sinuspersici]
MAANEVSEQCTSSKSNNMNSWDSQLNDSNNVIDNDNEIFSMEELGQVKEENQGTHTIDKDLDIDVSLQPALPSLDVGESLSNNHLLKANNDEHGPLAGQNEELGIDKVDGFLRLEDQCNNKNPSIRVVYSSLPSHSKRKLEELLHQWSEWHTQHIMSSKDPAECLESGEETYFPALHVGSESSSAVSFSMDVHVRKRHRTESLPLNNDCLSLYDRGYAVGLLSDEGITQESVVDMREAPRCFNCGSYNHPLGECQKPRDNAAVSSARKQFLNKKNQNGRARSQTRYYQESPGGKFDGLKPGSLSAETRKLMGLGELDPPPWLDRMRELGYPLGYFESEEDQPSGIAIYGDEETKNVDTSNDLPLDARTFQKKMTVNFPGINAPIPENADLKKWFAPVGPTPDSSWHHSDNKRWIYAQESVNSEFFRGIQGPSNHMEGYSSPVGLGLSPPAPHYPHNYYPREQFGLRGFPPGSPSYGSPDAWRPFLHYNYGSL